MTEDPLRPMPMSPEDIADLIKRTRAAMSNYAHARCRRSAHAARLRRWRAKRAAQA